MKTKAQKIIDNYSGGWLDLDLRGCDLKGVTLPTTVGGWLDLRGCDLKGVTLPATVGGWLDLRGCDLKGVTLPATVGGSIYLSGCDLKGVTLPKVIFGQPGQMIALDGEYLLWRSDAGLYYAGCRRELTREQALKHWDRTDDRAMLFTKSIKETP